MIVCAQIFLLLVLLDQYTVLLGYRLRFRSQNNQVSSQKPPSHRVAFLIAAHNEAHAIDGLIESIRALHYPEELVRIWLVADRCSDDTATIAEREGAIVSRRSSHDQLGLFCREGKGHALNDLLSEHCTDRELVDLFVILDADVRLVPDYLIGMIEVHRKGYNVVQGASFTKNSNTSELSCVNSFANRVQHIIQQGRYALGLSNLIIGNSLMIDKETMRNLNWTLARMSPTEEEIKIELTKLDIPIGYAAHAIVHEESVNELGALARQRSRWFRDYIVFLFFGGIPIFLGSLFTLRLKRTEAAFAHFFLTSQTLELLLFVLVCLASLATLDATLMIAGIVLLLGKLLYLGLLCASIGMTVPQMCRLAFSFPKLVIGWIAGVLMWVRHPSKTNWTHTEHQG